MEWIFLVLLVSSRFGHAEWNGPYTGVWWLVIWISLSGPGSEILYFGNNDLSLPQFRPGGNDGKNRSELSIDNKKITLRSLTSFQLP